MTYFDKAQPHSLTQLVASPDYFIKVAAATEKLRTITSQPEALEVLIEVTHLLGADVSAFASFIRDDESFESYRFLLACDPIWCLTYESLAWYASDPWLIYVSQHTQPCRGSDIKVQTAAQRKAVDLAEEFGFKSVAIVPAPSTGGTSRLGALCFGSLQPDFFECDAFSAFKFAARNFAMELHEWLIGVIKTELISSAGITSDDIQLLRLEQAGNATKDIARLLGLTARSVDSRFYRLNSKLGMPSRKSSMLVAQEHGLI